MATGLYHPLDPARREIRLLKIIPGNKSTPVSCRLHISSLDATPPYAALSYTWGDAVVTEEIHVDGKRLPVRTNLANVLRLLRDDWSDIFIDMDTSTLLLWADALCINQDDCGTLKRHNIRGKRRLLVVVSKAEESAKDQNLWAI
jgi:hypothetical protein